MSDKEEKKVDNTPLKSPNIDDPADGNKTFAMMNGGDKVKTDEANPTSESSKELSRKLANMTKAERAEFMHEEDSQANAAQQTAVDEAKKGRVS